MEEITRIFSETPSALYTLWKAFRSRKNLYSPGEEYPVIHASRPGFMINETHMKDFHEICDISRFDFLHILYPFTLVYPYILRVLCAKEMPVSMFKVLNTRNSIIMHRRIRPDERLDIDCFNSAPRIVPKGLEIDMKSVISSDGENIWENIAAYFCPGNFGPPDASYSTPRLDPITDAPVIKEWYLPAKDRFRFARVSGDSNGIHYGSFYARMMGFKRDFAQPIRVVAKCVSSLPNVEWAGQARLDFYLKGPVYYESALILKNIRTENGNRFDLYCSGNDKPVISGILYTL
jgi:hypothetical protein